MISELNIVVFREVVSSISPASDKSLGKFSMLHVPLAGEKVWLDGNTYTVYSRLTEVSSHQPRTTIIIRLIPEA